MSGDQKLDRVRVVSSRSLPDTPRRRRGDQDAPLIEIGGEREEREAMILAATADSSGRGINWRLLTTFMMGSAIGGMLAAMIGLFWGTAR